MEIFLILLIRIVAVVCGKYMLDGFNWARYLTIVWVGFFLVQSIFHTPLELLFRILSVMHTPWESRDQVNLLTVILCILFTPSASRYFRNARQAPS